MIFFFCAPLRADVFLDGVDDNINFGNLKNPTTAISVYMVVTIHSAVADDTMLQKTTSGAEPFISYMLKVTGTASPIQPSFAVGLAALQTTVGTDSDDLAFDTKYTFCGTWSSGNRIKFFKNGTLDAQSAGSPSGSITYVDSQNTYIGLNNLDNKNPHMTVHDFALWDVELSTEEVYVVCSTPSSHIAMNWVQVRKPILATTLDDFGHHSVMSGTNLIRNRAGEYLNGTPENSPLSLDEKVSYP